MQQQRPISRSDWDMWCKVDFIWQPAMTSLVAEPRKSSRALSKAKHTTKTVMVTAWWSAASMIHYSFLNPTKTITSESKLSKLMRCTKYCNTCSQHRSTERIHFFSTTSDRMLHNQRFKSWTNKATKFCLIHHLHLTSHQPTTTFLKHLNNFLQG